MIGGQSRPNPPRMTLVHKSPPYCVFCGQTGLPPVTSWVQAADSTTSSTAYEANIHSCYRQRPISTLRQQRLEVMRESDVSRSGLMKKVNAAITVHQVAPMSSDDPPTLPPGAFKRAKDVFWLQVGQIIDCQPISGGQQISGDWPPQTNDKKCWAKPAASSTVTLAPSFLAFTCNWNFLLTAFTKGKSNHLGVLKSAVLFIWQHNEP